MEKKTRSGGLGRAFIGIGLLVILLTVWSFGWYGLGLGLILIAVGFAIGGRIQL
jgi:hypothetical protein